MGRVKVDVVKAKAIAHEKRRAKREEEFKPHDEVIAKEIPGKSKTEAENARQKIRDKYDAIQAEIDAATDADVLLAKVKEYELV